MRPKAVADHPNYASLMVMGCHSEDGRHARALDSAGMIAEKYTLSQGRGHRTYWAV